MKKKQRISQLEKELALYKAKCAYYENLMAESIEEVKTKIDKIIEDDKQSIQKHKGE